MYRLLNEFAAHILTFASFVIYCGHNFNCLLRYFKTFDHTFVCMVNLNTFVCMVNLKNGIGQNHNHSFYVSGSPYDIVTFREDENYPRNDKCPNEFDFHFHSNEDRLIDTILENINSS